MSVLLFNHTLVILVFLRPSLFPSPNLHLHMDTRSFAKAMLYRLGLRIMPASPCPADHCDKELDEKGDHAMHCRDDHGIRGGRHDRIRDEIFKEAQRAGFNPKKEMPALIPGTQSRPADIFVEGWTFTSAAPVTALLSFILPSVVASLRRLLHLPCCSTSR